MAIAYNQVLVKDLDVVTTYKKLMAASIGQGSAYLKAKETLTGMLKDSTIKDTDKAAIISEMIVGLTNSITNKAMDTAVALDKMNRDAAYELTKLKEDTKLVTAQIAKVEKDTEETDWAVKNRVMAGWKVQAELYRDYGVQTWNQSVTTDIVPQAGYSEYGTKTETLKRAKVDTYATYANSYRQNGKVIYTTNATGEFNTVEGDATGLTHWQTEVAKRQDKGFDDNMRQHVVNSSASMISMLLSTEASGIDYTPYLNKWVTAADYLNTSWVGSSSGTTTGSIYVTTSSTLTAITEFTANGTTLNISAGRSVTLEFVNTTDSGPIIYAGSTIVQMDGTWSISIPTSVVGLFVVGKVYSVTIKTTDDTGNMRSVILSKTVV